MGKRKTLKLQMTDNLSEMESEYLKLLAIKKVNDFTIPIQNSAFEAYSHLTLQRYTKVSP